MPTAPQKKELVKLRLLVYLTEPVAIEFGVTQTDMARAVEREQGVTLDVLVADMVRDGLIERQSAEGRQAKPYFITEAGREYLDRQSSKALFPEVLKKQDWSATHSTDELQAAFAEKLRSLPEFRHADGGRVQEVGKMLADLARGKSQGV